MKHTLFLIGINLFLSCIQVRVNDDYSQDMGKTTTQNLTPFVLGEAGKDKIVAKPEEIVFQEVDAGNLKQIIGLNKKTWIYVWGSWCTPCRQKLPLIAQIRQNNPAWNIVLVADDYKIQSLQKLLFDQKIFVQAYILDHKRYGNKIYEKEKKLWEELNPGVPYEPAVPQNYIYDEKGSLRYYGTGSIPTDSLSQYFTIR